MSATHPVPIPPLIFILWFILTIVMLVTLVTLLLKRRGSGQRPIGPHSPSPGQGTRPRLAQRTPQHPTSGAAERKCLKIVLEAEPSDLKLLNDLSAELSESLTGKTVKPHDRLLFNGMSLAAADCRPDGPSQVTPETEVVIRAASQPLQMSCSSCGATLPGVRMICPSCRASLPVTKL